MIPFVDTLCTVYMSVYLCFRIDPIVVCHDYHPLPFSPPLFPYSPSLPSPSSPSLPALFPILIDVLKISDFGLFRHMDKERRLNRKCGMPPYVAPEVSRATIHNCPTATTCTHRIHKYMPYICTHVHSHLNVLYTSQIMQHL